MKHTVLIILLLGLGVFSVGCDDNPVDPYPSQKVPFVTTWRTTFANESITLTKAVKSLVYDYTVDWGDGSITQETGGAKHTYETAGDYQVSITGTFPAIFLGGTKSSQKLISIDQWGDIEWESMAGAFSNCKNMTLNATDAPNLSLVEDMSNMFSHATSFNGEISHWDVSNVTDMYGMFSFATSFNGDIVDWDVSNVTDMEFMFFGASSFNRDISNWNVKNLTNMSGIFLGARAFNQDIGNWNVGGVISMDGAFAEAIAFNQDISAWDVSNVTQMGAMFAEASAFNRDISAWDVSNVISMEDMLRGASSFNQDISNWNTLNVTRCESFAESSPIDGTDKVPTAGTCF